jgi:L-amino acid N-acyltransferase YncA
MDIGKVLLHSGLHYDMITIRPATDKDLTAILDIYNEAVENTTATFDTEKRPMEKQIEWYNNHKQNHPIIVAEENEVIKGWASLSPWSERRAYEGTVEVSVYVHHNFRNKGIGKKLLEIITLEGRKVKNHTVISRIAAGNESSMHIHEILGYRHVGVLKEVGFKFGRFIDVNVMQFLF